MKSSAYRMCSFRPASRAIEDHLATVPNRSKYINECIRVAMNGGYQLPADLREDIRFSVRNLRGFCANWNQIAHRANRSDTEIPSRETFQKLSNEMRLEHIPALQRIIRAFRP